MGKNHQKSVAHLDWQSGYELSSGTNLRVATVNCDIVMVDDITLATHSQ